MLNKIYRYFQPQQDPYSIKKKYGIPDNISLTVEFKDGWFIVTSPELPGLITEGRNGDELLGMVNDAILTYFDVPKKESDYVFNMLNINGVGRFSYDKKKVLQTA